MAKKVTAKMVTPQLVVKAPNRQSFDVGTWRNALRSADMGRVKTLYDLFDDLLIDGVLSDACRKAGAGRYQLGRYLPGRKRRRGTRDC